MFFCKDRLLSTGPQSRADFHESLSDLAGTGVPVDLYRMDPAFETDHEYAAIIRPPNQYIGNMILSAGMRR